MTTRIILPTLLVAAAAATSACAKKAPDANLAAAPPATAATSAAASDDAAGKMTTEQAMAKVVANLERIHFEYDSDRLTDDSMAALRDDAKILLDHRDIAVEIQGHCDARGTTEYNLALGQRRAQNVIAYLARSGVPESQVRAVSFGKEKPLDARDSEAAWAQNRRVEFRVTRASSVASVVGTVE